MNQHVSAPIKSRTDMLIIYAAVFGALNETIFSADKSLDDGTRQLNYILANSAAFLASSVFVYLKNRSWVFTAGRHTQVKEVALFYSVALFAYAISTPTGAYLVTKYDWNEYLALMFTISTSVLVNFLGRRFFVFHH